jgi:S-adenosylmethionine:tRNA ribosyltransferase-isomerase
LEAYPNLIAVGTTSLRTLESMYWMGQKSYINPGIGLEELEIKQWEPYDWKHPLCSVQEALQALMDWLIIRNLQQLVVRTGILIAPPYSIKTAKALITNFHQPQSTLLLLVAALVGVENWKTIYQHALNHDYRFLSYGDGSLLYNANIH